MYNIMTIADTRMTYSCSPVSAGDTLQDSQRTPDTMNSAEPYIYYVSFSCNYIPKMKFNL